MPLLKLPLLTNLNVSATTITDRTLSAAAECPRLTTLELSGCKQITTAGIERFRQALPNCKIQRDYPAKATTPNPGAAVGPNPPPAKAPFDAQQARTHQEAWAKHLGTTVETTNSVGAKMILIPSGEFLMGSTDEQLAVELKEVAATHGKELADRIRNSEQPQHRVTLTKPFWMGATEVTIGQFRKFAEAAQHQTHAEKKVTDAKSWTYLKPGYAVTEESPAAAVCWDDANAYCRWLSQQEQATYRLPTEAEWEFACRAGTTTAYSCGDQLLDSHEWSIRNSDVKAHPVALKRPNPFGLFDMHGNLSEWCRDRFDEKWYAQSPPTDPIGPETGTAYGLRGGNWDYNSFLRSAYRTGKTEDIFHYTIGFRVVREAPVRTTSVNETKSSTSTKSEDWLDVLPLIDPQRDKLEYPNLTGKNDWQMRDGELHYTGDAKNGKLVFPVKITGLHVEVEFDATRTSGTEHINVDLPSSKGPIPIELSRSGSIVQLGWPAVVVGKHSTKLGQRITYLVKIAKVDQQDVIDVFADGVSIGRWQGQRDAIGKPDPVKYPQATSSGFWTYSNTNWTIHRVRLRAPGGSVEPINTVAVESGWLELFNGKDLTGWQVMGVKGWAVEKGVMLGKTTTTAGSGWLMSEREFSDFELELEYKLGPGSNSGLFLRAWPEGNVSGKDFREIQLLDDESPGFASQPAKNRTGSLFGLVAPDVAPKVPADQWHRVRVHLQGQQLQLTINEVAVLQHTLTDLRPSGRIGLQLYPAKIEFRNVRVRPLTPSAGGPKP